MSRPWTGDFTGDLVLIYSVQWFSSCEQLTSNDFGVVICLFSFYPLTLTQRIHIMIWYSLFKPLRRCASIISGGQTYTGQRCWTVRPPLGELLLFESCLDIVFSLHFGFWTLHPAANRTLLTDCFDVKLQTYKLTFDDSSLFNFRSVSFF